jgi:ferredoxin, 2Fe-2S
MRSLVVAYLVEAGGTRHRVAGRAGDSLMGAAVDAGIDAIKADCGGMMSCATCHVFVAIEWAARLPPPSPGEEAMLEMTAAPRQATILSRSVVSIGRQREPMQAIADAAMETRR